MERASNGLRSPATAGTGSLGAGFITLPRVTEPPSRKDLRRWLATTGPRHPSEATSTCATLPRDRAIVQAAEFRGVCHLRDRRLLRARSAPGALVRCGDRAGAAPGPGRRRRWALGWADPSPLASIADGSAPAGASVALGFVRLSILDLSPTGSQPMVEPGGRRSRSTARSTTTWSCARARGAGLDVYSTGDSEVLLKGWLEWGEGVFARLNGMWAIAIYDADRDARCLLSRDRFGEKPLFWTAWRGGVAFASEVKQLSAFPGRLDPAQPFARGGYLRTGRPYLGPSSWFEGIHQLEPGSCPLGRPIRPPGEPLLEPSRGRRRGRATARSRRVAASLCGRLHESVASGCGRTFRSGRRCPPGSTARP